MTSENSEPTSFLINIYATNGGPEHLNRRLIPLPPNQQVILGRISKNQKTDFVAKSSNGYFDNPIISRRHAILENRNNQVFIMDENSTHGTLLNSEKLQPFEPKVLRHSDVVTLGCRIETKSPFSELEVQHNPAVLDIGIVVLPPTAESNSETVEHRKAASTNSFHAPDDSESEDEEPGKPRAWRPFSQSFETTIEESILPIAALVEATPSQPKADLSIIEIIETKQPEPALEVPRPPVVDLTLDSDPPTWRNTTMDMDQRDSPVVGQQGEEAYADEDDNVSERSDGEVEPAGYVPYQYDSEDKDSVNGDIEIPETQYINPTEKIKEWKTENVDSFDEVIRFLKGQWSEDLEETDSDYEDSSEEDEELYSDSDEESEESEEESQESEEESLHSSDEEVNEPGAYDFDYSWNLNPESAFEALLGHTNHNNAAQSLPAAPEVVQSHTPPETPEQLTRKRTYTPSPQTLDLPSPTTDTPITDRPILPLPKRRLPISETPPPKPTADYEKKLAELEQRERDFEQEKQDFESNKRRRTNRGGEWIKTVSKYTVAGMVGGIATLVGLAVTALSRDDLN